MGDQARALLKPAGALGRILPRAAPGVHRIPPVPVMQRHRTGRAFPNLTPGGMVKGEQHARAVRAARPHEQRTHAAGFVVTGKIHAAARAVYVAKQRRTAARHRRAAYPPAFPVRLAARAAQRVAHVIVLPLPGNPGRRGRKRLGWILNSLPALKRGNEHIVPAVCAQPNARQAGKVHGRQGDAPRRLHARANRHAGKARVQGVGDLRGHGQPLASGIQAGIAAGQRQAVRIHIPCGGVRFRRADRFRPMPEKHLQRGHGRIATVLHEVFPGRLAYQFHPCARAPGQADGQPSVADPDLVWHGVPRLFSSN